MRKNSILMASICAMTVVLMAGRCSDDEKKDASSSSAMGGKSETADPGKVDAGVEKDPLGETIGGDDATVPAGDDAALDEGTFEPEPTPEDAADL